LPQEKAAGAGARERAGGAAPPRRKRERIAMTTLSMTLIGGPTVLIEAGGFRLLTDPTFDAPGDYALSYVILTKTAGPALPPEAIGAVDAVLLSHDQHSDNLDRSGRAFLARAARVLTTAAGAARLGAGAEGLQPWDTKHLIGRDGRELAITATPARHGPAGIEPMSGDVVGFVLRFAQALLPAIYITGDTVWFDGVAEVARRFRAGVVVLFAGAAQTRGPFHLTMDTNDAIETAHAFPDAVIVPVHRDGWAHLTQHGAELEQAFSALGLQSHLKMLQPGVATTIELRK
jgi:L-ascorbate metabolism protein UlaG (beta-lactamase superfamily)